MMRKLLGVVSFGVMSALATGCGALGGGGGNDGGLFCSGDSNCSNGQICHPTAKICVTKCTSGNDCPSDSKNCTPVSGSADAGNLVSVCGCATTALCNTNGNTGLVCSDADKVCTKKCTADTECPSSRKCDTATGQCKPMGSATCSPDCGANQYCDTTGASPTCVDKCTYGTCGSGKVCNTTSGACETAKACSSSNAQPDTCGYGTFCSGSACGDVSRATCANFPSGSSALLWSPASSTGPVLYAVTDETTDDAAFCMSTNKAFTVTVKAYRTDADWPAQATAAPGFKYYNSAGASTSVYPSMRPSGYQPSGKNATFKITFCAPLASTDLTIGLAFDNGNPLCSTLAMGLPGTAP